MATRIARVKTLEKMAHAMEMQLYQILCEANVPSAATGNNRLDKRRVGKFRAIYSLFPQNDRQPLKVE
jgi:hypothetical protein